MQQSWNAANYARDGRFVAEMAGSLIDLLNPLPGEKILDLGCGDGFLTERIAARGAIVTGFDNSPSMIAAARERGIDAHEGDARALYFPAEFDAVFSNAALHWMPDQDAVLAGVARALKPGGRFAAEMGGHGNIASIRVALKAVLGRRGIPEERLDNYSFFTVSEYRELLERNGFTVEQIFITPRPTPLPAGIDGWLATFRSGLLEELPAMDRPSALEEIRSLLQPVLRDRAGNWIADYVRLRFLARRLEHLS